MSNEETVCHFCRELASSNSRMYFRQASQLHPQPVTLCEQCIELLYNSVQSIKNTQGKKTKAPAPKKQPEIPNFLPRDVFNHLNKFVIGQEEAKKTVSVAVFQHFERLKNPELTHKSNIMIVGPTGSGKTEIARAIASFLKVPFAQVDVTTMTPRGYVGDSPEICVEKLLMAAGGDVKAAERGIIFLDEFDKIPSGTEYGSFKAKAVQQEILKILEGDKVDVKVGGEQGQKVSVDTSKILFIAAGSFVGLDGIINSETPKTIGLVDQLNVRKEVTSADLATLAENKHFETFGLIPEVMGRLPIVCFTSELSKEDLCRILTEPKASVLSHYQAIFESSGSKLTVDRECLLKLAEKAIKDKLGARGLKKQLESTFKHVMFEIDNYKGMHVVITADGVRVEPLVKELTISNEGPAK